METAVKGFQDNENQSWSLIVEACETLLHNILQLGEVISYEIFSPFPFSLIGWIFINFCNLPAEMHRCNNICTQVVCYLLIQTLPWVIHENHHVHDLFVKVDGMLIMFDFVKKVKNVRLYNLLLILWNSINVILWRRVPFGQHVVLQRW